MSWFEAYMLWNIGSFKAFFIFVAVLSGIASFLLFPIYDIWQEEHPPLRMLIPALSAGIVFAILGVFTPSTEDLLKIIATKKGSDAVQSQTFQGYVDKSAKTIDNALELLNQTIEKKLDKKAEKK